MRCAIEWPVPVEGGSTPRMIQCDLQNHDTPLHRNKDENATFLLPVMPGAMVKVGAPSEMQVKLFKAIPFVKEILDGDPELGAALKNLGTQLEGIFTDPVRRTKAAPAVMGLVQLFAPKK